MRTQIIFLVALLLSVFSVNAQETDNITWPIEPRNERVERLLELDSLNYSIMGDIRNNEYTHQMIYESITEKQTPAEQIMAEMDKLYNDIEENWKRFVWLCNEGRDKEAIEIYKNNPFHIDLRLSHSALRFMFHDEVLGFLAYENLPEAEAHQLMIDALSFDYIMLAIQWQSTSDEWYFELLDNAYYLLMQLYQEAEQYDKAFELIDRHEPNRILYDDSAFGRCFGFIAKAQLYVVMGEKDKSLSLLKESKMLIEAHLANNPNDEEAPQAIKHIDSLIEFVNEQL